MYDSDSESEDGPKIVKEEETLKPEKGKIPK